MGTKPGCIQPIGQGPSLTLGTSGRGSGYDVEDQWFIRWLPLFGHRLAPYRGRLLRPSAA